MSYFDDVIEKTEQEDRQEEVARLTHEREFDSMINDFLEQAKKLDEHIPPAYIKGFLRRKRVYQFMTESEIYCLTTEGEIFEYNPALQEAGNPLSHQDIMEKHGFDTIKTLLSKILIEATQKAGGGT